MTTSHRRYRYSIGVVAVAGAAALLGSLWWPAATSPPAASASSAHQSERSPQVMRVATVRPTARGTPRRASLPCEAHWYDYANLVAKVSGYLEELEVDIGSRVTKGQPLARIGVPELEQDAAMAAATLKHMQATVKQTEARKKSALAEQRAAEAACLKAEADLERWTAEQTFREKEYQRFRTLGESESVQAAVVDEKLFQFQSAQAGRRSAEVAILTAKEAAAAAQARVELAEADLGVVFAQVKIAETGVAKAKVLVSFARIVSPYDGVVTERHFHLGDFIRAADKGNVESLLMVGRTDRIRVVVQIPDREVPYAHAGDAVTIEFDSLPGRTFETTLARISYAEDVATRTMRAEADLPNDEGLIVDQMYGRMEIQLEPAANRLTLPSSCLVDSLKDGRGQFFLVKEGVAKLVPVTTGAHDGITIEILDGLKVDDDVVVQPPPGLTDGTAVAAEAGAKSHGP